MAIIKPKTRPKKLRVELQVFAEYSLAELRDLQDLIEYNDENAQCEIVDVSVVEGGAQ